MRIKNFVASAFMAMFGISAMAQTDLETFQFVDKDGNVVTDGSEITVSTPEMKGQNVQINSGLYVKNTTNEEQAVGLTFSIDQLDNGASQCCFPVSCLSGTDHVGNYDGGSNSMAANEVKSFETEWLPTTYGTCKMTFQLLVNKIGSKSMMGITVPTYDEFKAYGPKIQVNFVYSDPASVNGIVSDKAKPVAYYNLAGQKTDVPQKGVNIVVLSNGKTIKVINK